MLILGTEVPKCYSLWSLFSPVVSCIGASQVVLVVKNLSANAWSWGVTVLSSPLRSWGVTVLSSPLCLENPRDGGAW